MTQVRCCPAQFVSKSSEQTFVGTRFGASENVCHKGRYWRISRKRWRDDLMTLFSFSHRLDLS